MPISLPEGISSVSEGTTPCIPASNTSVGLTNPVLYSREQLDDTTETSSTGMNFHTGDWTSQPRGSGSMATAGGHRSTGVSRVALLPLHRIPARRRLR
jgi:hypothetical protein